MMRTLLIALLLSAPALFPTLAKADDRPRGETYRGYYLDLSAIEGRQNFSVIVNALRQQIDIVESVGLSPRVLNFFRTVPIVMDEMACLSILKDHPDMRAVACYGHAAPKRPGRTSREPTVWDSAKFQWTNPDPIDLAEDTKLGVVMVRPLRLAAQEPVMLHEMLHAYHARIFPEGIKTPAVLLHYDLARSKTLYPAEAYLLTNEKEFFAVTASVFLYGQAGKEPFTRANLKEKQPEYFNYLVWMFGFDPSTPGGSPVASAR